MLRSTALMARAVLRSGKSPSTRSASFGWSNSGKSVRVRNGWVVAMPSRNEARAGVGCTGKASGTNLASAAARPTTALSSRGMLP